LQTFLRFYPGWFCKETKKNPGKCQYPAGNINKYGNVDMLIREDAVYPFCAIKVDGRDKEKAENC
jgi:hypothetical protein